MRVWSSFALLATASALAGCAGGSALNSTASLSSGCGVTSVSVSCPGATGGGTTGGGTTGGGTTGGGTTGGGTTTNGGNTTTLATGDTTLIVENNVLTNGKNATSQLTIGTAPNTAKINIDTKQANNAAWPIAKTMDEYTPGSAQPNGPVGNFTSSSGANYKEYRAYSKGKYDEELQVWSWGNSYGTHYRDVTSGGPSAAHEAWSFGGTPTAALPGSGSKTYTGRFTGIATTSNFVDSKSPLQTLSYNNTWRVVGASSVTADWGAGTLKGTLTPEQWWAEQTLNGAQGLADANNSAAVNRNPIVYNTNINLDLGIKAGTATAQGTAKIDPTNGWLNNGTTPAYAGFYGPGASEVTGAFNVDGTIPAPIGGGVPLYDDRRGFYDMTGIFNAQ